MKVIQNSMVLDLRVHAPGFRKSIDSEDVLSDDDADADLIHVSKDLIDKSALTDMRRAYGAVVRWIRVQEVPLPSQMLRGGMYLIPLELVEIRGRSERLAVRAIARAVNVPETA